jgi:hypothetical protein
MLGEPACHRRADANPPSLQDMYATTRRVATPGRYPQRRLRRAVPRLRADSPPDRHMRQLQLTIRCLSATEARSARTPGVPPQRTGNDLTPHYASSNERRSSSYACVLGLRNEKVRGRIPLAVLNHVRESGPSVARQWSTE